MARFVRVATVAQLGIGGPTVQHNLERICCLVGQAAAERPDIICLPETFLELGVPFRSLDQVAETVPGPTTEELASHAKRHGCYVICPLTVCRDGVFTNEAVLIDRQGQIVGTYAKIHPVVEGSDFSSLEKGVTPGGEAPVFDVDFGRIAMQICFDIHWPETWAELRGRGAEIVFWSSAYDGGKHLSIHAWNNHYYVVSAVKSRYARIIDLMGAELAVTGPRDPIVVRRLNLDVGLFHADFNQTQIPYIRTKYGPEVTIRVWHEEGLFILEANREGLSVPELATEFSLEYLDAYLQRNERLQDAWRSSEPVPDLTPPYLGREQWV
ncbi:MAG: carbon-nitrogen hydrolase family protein [Chloroflexi bacterium]|nr:carbon-nitrogen hydrolase family protein [Chloroflexota bacterium]